MTRTSACVVVCILLAVAPAMCQEATAPPAAAEGAAESGEPKLVTNAFFDTALRQALSDGSPKTGVATIPTE